MVMEVLSTLHFSEKIAWHGDGPRLAISDSNFAKILAYEYALKRCRSRKESTTALTPRQVARTFSWSEAAIACSKEVIISINYRISELGALAWVKLAGQIANLQRRVFAGCEASSDSDAYSRTRQAGFVTALDLLRKRNSEWIIPNTLASILPINTIQLSINQSRRIWILVICWWCSLFFPLMKY